MDEHRIESAAQLLQVTTQIVLLGGGSLCRIAGVVNLRGPVGDASRALLVEDVRGAYSVRPEDCCQRLVADGLGRSGERGLQLAGQRLQADEVALRVVGRNSGLLHRGGRFLGRIGQAQQHRLE